MDSELLLELASELPSNAADDLPDTDAFDLSEITAELFDDDDADADQIRAELRSVGIYV